MKRLKNILITTLAVLMLLPSAIIAQAVQTGTTPSDVVRELYYSVTKQADTIGADIFLNGTLDSWADGEPVSWNVIETGGTGTISEEATIVHTPAGKAMKLTVGAGENGSVARGQLFTGLTPGNTYRLDAWGYVPSTNAGSTEAALLLTNDVVGEVGANEYLDQDTKIWTAYVGDPSGGSFDFNTSDDVYQNLNATTNFDFVVPSSGKIFVVALTAGMASAEGDDVYYDDISLKPITTGADVKLFPRYNASDVKDLTTDDFIDFSQLEDSTSIAVNPIVEGKFYPLATIYSVAQNLMAFYTDAASVAFVNGATLQAIPIETGTPLIPTQAVNQENSTALIAVSDTVDLKVTGNVVFNIPGSTTDYELPTGYELENPRIGYKILTADALAGNGTFTVGTNSPNNDNIFGTYLVTGDAVGESRHYDYSGFDYVVCSTPGKIYINVTSADLGTAGTARFFLYGTLITTN